MEAENRFHIIVGEDIDRGRSVFNLSSSFYLSLSFICTTNHNENSFWIEPRTLGSRIFHCTFLIFCSYSVLEQDELSNIIIIKYYFYNIILDPNFFILHFYSLFLLLYLKSEITESFTYLFIF